MGFAPASISFEWRRSPEGNSPAGRIRAHSGEFRSLDLATDGAWSDAHLRIVTDALAFSGIGARHHVELAVRLAKPYGGRHRDPGLAESGQGNVVLTMNFGWNGASHRSDCKGVARKLPGPRYRSASGAERLSAGLPLGGLGTVFCSVIARNPIAMLKAKHAQMDERAL